MHLHCNQVVIFSFLFSSVIGDLAVKHFHMIDAINNASIYILGKHPPFLLVNVLGFISLFVKSFGPENSLRPILNKVMNLNRLLW